MFQFRRKAASSFQRLHRGVAVAVCASTLMLTACSSLVNPYRAEVVQGNFVSLEQVQALRPGMPRPMVRDILGTPLVTSLFHTDRWDYAFTINRQGAEPQQRRFSVFFKGDALDRVEGDPLPTEAEFAAKLDTRKAPKKLPALKASEEELAKFPAKSSAAPAPAKAVAPAAALTYPPLESPAR
ncbi:MAG: hypothetical protein RLZZ470_577 [Pseudomonadota bacterium]|jgi:outer membrane protein assembly factor BamE